MKAKITILVFISCLITGIAYAGDIRLNMRPGYLIPTHGFYNGWNPQGRQLRAAFSSELQYTYSTPGSKAYQGVGLGVHTFFAHDMLGTPVDLYILQGAPLVQVCSGLSFGYEWNFGLSAGWKDNGQVIVSPVNAYINVALLFDWTLNRYWSLVFGPEYTHFSNGDTKFPNGGANSLNFRAGVKCDLMGDNEAAVQSLCAHSKYDRASFADMLSYDLTVYGAWRADRYTDSQGHLVIDNRSYAVFGVQLNPLYHFTDCLSAGASLDLMYDASANRNFNKGIITHCAAGISVRGELEMPIFCVNVGAGYNLLYSGPDLKGFYGMFSLKGFLTESLYLNVGYRLGQTNYAHNMMFGIGWRFRKPH